MPTVSCQNCWLSLMLELLQSPLDQSNQVRKTFFEFKYESKQFQFLRANKFWKTRFYTDVKQKEFNWNQRGRLAWRERFCTLIPTFQSAKRGYTCQRKNVIFCCHIRLIIFFFNLSTLLLKRQNNFCSRHASLDVYKV